MNERRRVRIRTVEEVIAELLGDRFAVVDGLVVPKIAGGGNQARDVTVVDASGNPVGSSGAAPLVTRIQDGVGTSIAVVVGNADTTGAANPSLQTIAGLALYDGNVSLVRGRAASALNLSAQSGLGAALVAPPGMWSVASVPAGGSQATATRAAGGAGVRHVFTSALFTAGAQAAPTGASSTSCNVIDGISGGAAYLERGAVSVPAAATPTIAISMPSRHDPGTAATAMTGEFGSALASVQQSSSLGGYDAS